MTLSCQWLGHTNLLFDTGMGSVLFQPFFRQDLWPWQRLTPTNPDAPDLKTITNVFFGNPHRDRLDLNALKYFRQKTCTIHLPPKLAHEARKFFHFNLMELQDQSKTECNGLKIQAIATPTRCLRLRRWHNEMFHFVVETADRRIIILSDLPRDGSVWDAFAGLGQAHAVFAPMEKLSLLALWKKTTPQLETLRRMVDFLQIEKVLPYAYGDYGRQAPIDVGNLQNQLSQSGLTDKTVWIKRGEAFAV